jgi:hypothetical protein
MDRKYQSENAYDSFSHMCDSISGPESTWPGSRGTNPIPVRHLHCCKSGTRDNPCGLAFLPLWYGVVWAHLQRATEDAGRHVVGFRWRFCFICRMRFHKASQIRKIVLVFCRFLLTRKKKKGGETTVQLSLQTESSDIQSPRAWPLVESM